VSKIDVWVVSTNEEHFSSEEFKSKEDAIKNGAGELCLEDDESFYIGKVKKYIFPTMCAEDFFCNEIDRDVESLGDWSEYWEESFRKKEKLIEKINNRLSEITDLIMTEHKPTFYIVTDIELFNSDKG